ncbi:Acyltransferase mlcH [Hypsizygus marmoreus]|uniref:Acyltransferase mlcH n=1 Tax=Hypsizygus marmoreus TaxID=39966 RepID=A0A369J516_HYPMA|nr:Acyltransferase mlcH [Hypsizygus marmoreus]
MAVLSDQTKQHIQNILTNAVESGRTPGLVFGASSAEKELLFAHAGPRVFGDSSSGPLSSESVFWICSQTKMIVSIATFQLIEAGKIGFDTLAKDILPELANPIVLSSNSTPDEPNFRPAKGDIKIRHLLNHSSGLFYDSEKGRASIYHLNASYLAKHDKQNPVPHFCSMIRGSYPSQPLKFEPGTSFAYSYAADFLGFIVERITGQSLEEYLKEHVFLPLGITSASFYLTPELQKDSVGFSFRGPDGTIAPWADQVPLMVRDPAQVHLHLGGTGLYCSMKDYLTLLRHLLQVHAGFAVNPLISSSSLRTFFEPTLTPEGERALGEALQATGYSGTDCQWSTALCLNTANVPGKRRKGSGWWYGWAGTYYMLDPETGIALVLGSQSLPRRDPEVFKIWAELEEAFYGGLS